MPPKKTAKDWLESISKAKKVKENWRERFRIPVGYDYWEGVQRPSGWGADEWITINMVYSCLQAELPTLYSTDPYYYVKLAKTYTADDMERQKYEQMASVRQSMLNYLKRETDLKSKARMAILDAHFQYGVLKVHYKADRVRNPDYGSAILDGASGMPILDDSMEPYMEPEFLPANEAFCISRIHPDDFLVDADAGPLQDDICWKAQRIRIPVEDAKADTTYRLAARKLLQPTEISDPEWKQQQYRNKGSSIEIQQPEPDMVVLWEIYDLRKKQWLTVAEGCNEFLIKPEALPPGIDKDPFVELRFTLRDSSWYTIPAVSQWLDAQREYCEIRSKVLTHRKRYNRKYEIYSPGFDDPDRAKALLADGPDGTILDKNQPMQCVFPIADAPLDQQVHTEYAYTRQDFQDLAVGSNQRASAQGVDSATEAGIIERRTQTREGDKVGIVMDFLSDVARKLDQCVQAHLTRDMAVAVTGPGGEEIWQEIRTADYDEINGEYAYTIAVGSTTPQLPEIERAQWLGFLSWLTQAMQVAPDLVTTALVRKTAELHHISPDDPLVKDISAAAQARVQAGMIPQPGGQGGQNPGGSQPGIPNMDLGAMFGGAAEGVNNIRGGEQ